MFCLEITNWQIGQCRVYIELVSTCLPVSCVITPFLHCINKKHMILPKRDVKWVLTLVSVKCTWWHPHGGSRATEQALNAEVYGTLSARSYSDTSTSGSAPDHIKPCAVVSGPDLNLPTMNHFQYCGSFSFPPFHFSSPSPCSETPCWPCEKSGTPRAGGRVRDWGRWRDIQSVASWQDAQAQGEVGVAPEALETHPLAQDCEKAGGGGRKVCVLSVASFPSSFFFFYETLCIMQNSKSTLI